MAELNPFVKTVLMTEDQKTAIHLYTLLERDASGFLLQIESATTPALELLSNMLASPVPVWLGPISSLRHIAQAMVHGELSDRRAKEKEQKPKVRTNGFGA
jgi:hypothetical protein